MAIGPGKYDDIATSAREQSGALGVIVIVIGGSRGPVSASRRRLKLPRGSPNCCGAWQTELSGICSPRLTHRRLTSAA